MTLAVDTNIDPFSSFTSCILAVHLRLNAGFVNIDDLFLGECLLFFSNMPPLVLGFVLCKMYSFLSRNLSFRKRFSTEAR